MRLGCGCVTLHNNVINQTTDEEILQQLARIRTDLATMQLRDQERSHSDSKSEIITPTAQLDLQIPERSNLSDLHEYMKSVDHSSSIQPQPYTLGLLLVPMFLMAVSLLDIIPHHGPWVSTFQENMPAIRVQLLPRNPVFNRIQHLG